MAVTSETVRGGATKVVGAALAMSSALAVSGAACLGSTFSIAAWTQACTLGLALSRQASMLPPPPRMQAITMGLPTLFRQLSMNFLGLMVATAGFCGSGAADTSEVALGGTSALAGADFALSFALGASSTLAVAGFGCDFAVAASTHAWTRGLAL